MTTINDQQQPTAPAGFKGVEMRFAEDHPETFISYQGPKRGHVDTFWNEGRGVTVALDGLGEGGREGMDISPDEARCLISDLTSVVEQLDALDAPEVARIAQELHRMGKRATVTDAVRMSADADVSAGGVMTAYAAMLEADK